MSRAHPTPPVFSLFIPENPLPLIFDSPHSGTHYPPDFAPACTPKDLRQIEDSFVDELFGNAPAFGGTLLTAQVSRAYIDLNRAETDIDPRLLSAPWPGPAAPTSRSENGIGLIHRIVRPGVPLYDRKLAPSEIQTRIETVWKPYHTTLKALIDDAHFRFGQVWHLNCHAMPVQSGASAKTPDFVLGDRDGTSCAPDFTDMIGTALRNMGYRVAINDPYKGVELVRRYAAPTAGRHSLQIEISKALYLNDRTAEKSRNFNSLENDLSRLCEIISTYVSNATLTTLAAD